MKKYLAVLTACAVLLSGCSAGGEKKEERSLYARGLHIIGDMETMAGSDAYRGLMTSSPEVLDILREISEGDYSQPKAVYEVRIEDPEALDIALAHGGSSASLPEELKQEFEHRLVAAVPSMMSGFNGASSLAAISLITSEDFFLDEDVDGEILYIYVYDGSYCATVLFSARGEAIVSASGRFICNDALGKAVEEEAFMEWIKAYTGAAGISVSAVSVEDGR